jgi:hypothetical protein
MKDFSISNIDIEQTMDALNIPLNWCVSKDGLINYHNLNLGNYVINLGDASTNGTHWVALIVRSKECLYYDSYGQIYPNDVKHFIRKKKCIYNTDQVQDLTDTTCGYYAMTIIHFCHINKQYPLSKCLNLFNEQFSEDTDKNRLILQQYMKNIIYS